MRRLAAILFATAVALGAPSVARATEVSLAMDDGVHIFASLLEPSGTPPTGGWPGVMMFHGLGGSHDDWRMQWPVFAAGFPMPLSAGPLSPYGPTCFRLPRTLKT